MLDVLRQCLRMLPPAQRRRWMIIPILGLVTGLAEAGTAAAVFGLIAVIGDPTTLTRTAAGTWLAAHLPRQGAGAVIVQLTLLVAVWHLGKNLLIAAAQHLRHRIVGESSAVLACQMLYGYLLAPYPFHFRRDSAELIRNTTHCVDAVSVALSSAASIGSELLVSGGIIAVLLVTAPVVTVGAGATLVLLVIGLLRMTRRMARRAGGRQHALNREMLKTLQHALSAIKEIKALGREDFFYRAYAEQQQTRLALGHLAVTLETLPPLIIETVFVGGALLVVVLLTVTGGGGATSLPTLGLFAYAGFRIVPIANRTTWKLNEIRSREAPIRKLYDDYLLLTHAEPAPAAGETAVAFRETIALQEVAYTYPGAPAPALQGVSLSVRRGQSLGVVGPTGAGKSTLIDLIVGLLPPDHGRVCIDGVDLAGRERAWRRHVGYVPQAIVLLDDTLHATGIALGIADRDIDDARVRSALRIAQLADKAATLPDGLDTLVGERGVRLSGGERQRIGIARALYHDPDVLVLDEATAALDTATEAAVADALRALRGQKTVLIIAHRLSTVRGCDRIAVIADGRHRLRHLRRAARSWPPVPPPGGVGLAAGTGAPTPTRWSRP
ncbi:MAG: ABC transporter ATP-binding protein [Candidatus Binatia bacterium]